MFVKGAAAQTGDLQQWQNSANVNLARIDANGCFVSSMAVTIGTMTTSGAINNGKDSQFGSGSFSSGTIQGSAFSVGGSTLSVHDGRLDVPGNTKLSMTMSADDYVMVSSTVRFNKINPGCTDYYGEWNNATYTWTCKFSGIYDVSAHLGGVVLPAGITVTMEITGINNGLGSDLECRQVNWDAVNPQVFAFHIARSAYITAGNTLYVKFYSNSSPENSRIYSTTQWADFSITKKP
jgi:hypothetical protein